ncbi:hypothetical protein CFN13_13890 [Staphylococcus aureus]|nr:hypothetical protein TW63_13410 [Staphylococcus aureus]ATW81399.1 hypothetical protein CFN13_13890 [Staphylococcus aureus]MDH2928594.1 hypothetical protein [Staphylococcus aureus]OHW19085.1 hypothetical protein BKL89_07545 [Staphylococcus aureus]OHW24248.1 hypothetical protein BKL68_08225 [Staphylococcus aureus]
MAGPQQREIGFPISTDNASWRGPNIKNFEKKFYKQCKLGWDDEINFAKISFLPHSHWHLRSLNVQLEYMYNNIKHAVKRSQSIQTDFAHRVFLT